MSSPSASQSKEAAAAASEKQKQLEQALVQQLTGGLGNETVRATKLFHHFAISHGTRVRRILQTHSKLESSLFAQVLRHVFPCWRRVFPAAAAAADLGQEGIGLAFNIMEPTHRV